MSDIEVAVFTILSEDPEVNALVGARIFPQPIPQDAPLPAIAYSRISTRRVRSHGGPSKLARPRFQFVVSANAYAEAKTVSAAVRSALDGLKEEVDGLEVQGAWLDNDADEYGDDGQLRSIRMDFMIWHREE